MQEYLNRQHNKIESHLPRTLTVIEQVKQDVNVVYVSFKKFPLSIKTLSKILIIENKHWRLLLVLHHGEFFISFWFDFHYPIVLGM